MISLKSITEATETALNTAAESAGIPQRFKLVTDTGVYQDAVRDGNTVTTYINGVVSAVSSEIVPNMGGIKVATQTARLELLVGIDDSVTIDEFLTPIKAVIESVCQTPKVTVLTDEDDEAYTATVLYSLLNTNDLIDIRQGIGRSIPFIAYIYLSYVTNGINSADISVKWNGAQIPYTACQLTRSLVNELLPRSDTDGVSVNYVISTALGLDLSLPALKQSENALSTALINFILTGQQEDATVVITIDGTVSTYTMKFGESSLSIEGIQNAGHKISLIEVV